MTGVGRPVGWEMARALASRGHAVHLTDSDAGLAAQAAAELGASAFGSALDVRSLPACRAAASRTRRRLGSLEVWVNADAVTGSAAVWELDERTRQRILDVNLLGVINGTLAALEVMRPAGRGHVINLAELPGLLSVGDGQAMQSATRHGVIAFSLAVLADLRAAGFGEVSVSCLCPSRKLAAGGDGPRLPAGHQARPLATALFDLLENPRALVAVPRWREVAVRARWLWPAVAPLGSRLRPGARGAGSSGPGGGAGPGR